MSCIKAVALANDAKLIQVHKLFKEWKKNNNEDGEVQIEKPFSIKVNVKRENGIHYYGEVKDGEFHGHGKMTWPNGNCYEG